MGITITRGNITDSTTDAIVNAANDRLAEGAGVCGAIFEAARLAGGHAELTNVCRRSEEHTSELQSH